MGVKSRPGAPIWHPSPSTGFFWPTRRAPEQVSSLSSGELLGPEGLLETATELSLGDPCARILRGAEALVDDLPEALRPNQNLASVPQPADISAGFGVEQAGVQLHLEVWLGGEPAHRSRLSQLLGAGRPISPSVQYGAPATACSAQKTT